MRRLLNLIAAPLLASSAGTDRMDAELDFCVEPLESRQMLANVGGHVEVPGIQGANARHDFVAVQAGHLVIWGTDDHDEIQLQRVGSAGDEVRVVLNGQDRGQFTAPTDIVVYGKEGNDSIRSHKKLALRLIADGGSGSDSISGGQLGDALIGGPGDDTLEGNDGDDQLWGDAGTDKLIGNKGNDRLYASTGGDKYKGGSGNNQLIDDSVTYDVITNFNVTYITRGDLALKADIYIPDGAGPFPGVVMIHGGFYRSGDKSTMAGRATELASQGFTVVAINYRLSPEFLFPAHLEDAKSAVRWMRTNASTYKIDPDHIAAYGYSAGANIALLLGTTDPSDGLEGPGVPPGSPSSRVQAVVAGGAPVDFTQLDPDDDSYVYLFGGTRAEVPELYESISPVYSVTSDDPPMFLFHGTRDNVVRQPTAMLDALDQAGIEHDFYAVRGKGHILAAYDAEALQRSIDFLKEHV